MKTFYCHKIRPEHSEHHANLYFDGWHFIITESDEYPDSTVETMLITDEEAVGLSEKRIKENGHVLVKKELAC